MSTPPKRPEHANKRTAISGAPGYEIERRLGGYSYPANGNVHNPTPRYRWNLYLSGALVDSDSKRAPLVAEARKDAYR